MTKRECAIVQAYTGFVMLAGKDVWYFLKYIQELISRPVWTHELINETVRRMVEERAKPDFIELCRTAVDDRAPTDAEREAAPWQK